MRTSYKTFLIADTHFNDNNILKYENRPFADVEAMNSELIHNWNSIVHTGDFVYVLGDIGNDIAEILPSLNGTKILIRGNHDTESSEYYRKIGFADVCNYPIILDNFWILSHEPIYVNSNMPYANIFGHVHNSPMFKNYSSQHFCVSVERINYTPISFEAIKECVKEAVNNE